MTYIFLDKINDSAVVLGVEGKKYTQSPVFSFCVQINHSFLNLIFGLLEFIVFSSTSPPKWAIIEHKSTFLISLKFIIFHSFPSPTTQVVGGSFSIALLSASAIISAFEGISTGLISLPAVFATHSCSVSAILRAF
ncbi:Uncharacterised protein [Campylobacter geochelonis]|nr:Uncharacterised protein [Campylobacter geochelonis]